MQLPSLGDKILLRLEKGGRGGRRIIDIYTHWNHRVHDKNDWLHHSRCNVLKDISEYSRAIESIFFKIGCDVDSPLVTSGSSSSAAGSSHRPPSSVGSQEAENENRSKWSDDSSQRLSERSGYCNIFSSSWHFAAATAVSNGGGSSRHGVNESNIIECMSVIERRVAVILQQMHRRMNPVAPHFIPVKAGIPHSVVGVTEAAQRMLPPSQNDDVNKGHMVSYLADCNGGCVSRAWKNRALWRRQNLEKPMSLEEIKQQTIRNLTKAENKSRRPKSLILNPNTKARTSSAQKKWIRWLTLLFWVGVFWQSAIFAGNNEWFQLNTQTKFFAMKSYCDSVLITRNESIHDRYKSEKKKLEREMGRRLMLSRLQNKYLLHLYPVLLYRRSRRCGPPPRSQSLCPLH